MLIGSVASRLWRCGNRSRIEAFGLRQRSGAFTVCFPSWNDILFICAGTPSELVRVWQPPFQKIKCFSCLFSCVPVLLHAINRHLDHSLFKEFLCSLSLSLSCIFCFSRSVMVGWQKVQFRSQRAKVQRSDLCVFTMRFCACLRSAQFSKHVSRQHLRKLSGFASKSLAHSHERTILTMGVCFVVFRTKNDMDSWFIRAACAVWIELCCSWLSACGWMRSRGMCHEWHAKTHIFVF